MKTTARQPGAIDDADNDYTDDPAQNLQDLKTLRGLRPAHKFHANAIQQRLNNAARQKLEYLRDMAGAVDPLFN